MVHNADFAPQDLLCPCALLRSTKMPPSEKQIEESLAGNLCSCTGYRPIIDVFRTFAKVLEKIILERKAHETSSCKAILEQLRWYAGNQIKMLLQWMAISALLAQYLT